MFSDRKKNRSLSVSLIMFHARARYISRVREEITGRESGRAAETKFKPIESEELIKDIDFPQVLGVWSTSYIPKGTRFGPLVGHVYTKDSVPADANRKYFWRVRIVRAPPFKKKKKKKNTTLAGISQAIGYHIVGKSRWMGLTETGRGGEGEKKTRGRRKGRGKDRERSLQRPETGFSRSSEP